MKKVRNILTGIVILLTLGACDSFLDVKPKGTVEQKKQFEDVQGYRDAMYGIYASMAKTDLYGQALSFGFTDQIGQLFYDKFGTKQPIYKIGYFQYKDSDVAEVIDKIWAKEYECISFVNNVIENIEKEDVRKDADLTLIKGEAYALRAFLHFDVMRLFCDSYKLNKSAGGIPYSFTFDLSNKKMYTLKECYDYVLKDLSTAQQYLRDDKDIYAKDGDAYRVGRYSHCNQYAAWAIKARVFHYKGDLDSAAYYAEKVITSSGGTLTRSKDFPDVIRFSSYNKELVWGLYTRQLYTPYHDLFLGSMGGGSAVYTYANLRDLYEVASAEADSKDLRFNEFFMDSDAWGQYAFVRLLKKDEKENALSGVCLIRLPEMYYILSEYWYGMDKTKSLGYFNAVRNSRGLKNIPENRVNTLEKFAAELVAERCREFYGEGQIFFTYKCDNLSFMDARGEKEIAPSTDIFVLPWPKSEQEYGVTNK